MTPDNRSSDDRASESIGPLGGSCADTIGAIAHELRQWLGVATHQVQLIGDETGTPGSRARSLISLRASVEALADLTDALVDLERLARDEVVPTIADFDLVDLTRATVEALDEAVRDRDLKHAPTVSTSPVRGDAVLVRRALVLLLRHTLSTHFTGPLEVSNTNDGSIARVGVGDVESFEPSTFAAGPHDPPGLLVATRLAALAGAVVDLGRPHGELRRWAIRIPLAS